MNGIELLTPRPEEGRVQHAGGRGAGRAARRRRPRRRDQQGLLDGPLGGAQRRLRGRQRRHAPRPLAGLLLRPRAGPTGSTPTRSAPRICPAAGRRPNSPRPGHLQGLEESGAGLGVPEDGHQRAPGDQAFGTGTKVLTGNRAVNEELHGLVREGRSRLAEQVLETQLENTDKLIGNWPFAKDAAAQGGILSGAPGGRARPRRTPRRRSPRPSAR